MRSVLPAVDAAVVVCEADEKKVPQLQLILRELEDQNIPHFLFLNKIDKADKRVRETIKLLQPASRVPLLLRQIPIWNGDIISGFVDLALERAYVYKEHAPSEIVELKGENLDRKKEARFTMLETLADHDDQLMEQLLEDIEPPRDKVFDDLSKELRDRIVCPVLLGVATRTNGVLRLLKALRHGRDETPEHVGVFVDERGSYRNPVNHQRADQNGGDRTCRNAECEQRHKSTRRGSIIGCFWSGDTSNRAFSELLGMFRDALFDCVRKKAGNHMRRARNNADDKSEDRATCDRHRGLVPFLASWQQIPQARANDVFDGSRTRR